MEIGIYSTIKSPIQKIDIRLRMLAFLLILPAVTVLASIPLLFGLMILTLLLFQFSRINIRIFWRTAKFYVIFSFISFLILSLVIHQVSYPARALKGLLLGARFATLISFGMIYAFTTNPNEIPQALMKLQIPHRFGVLIMIGFRLYPLILQKMTTISEAIKARGIDTRISIFKPIRTFKTIQLMAAPFVIAALETGAQLGDTMVSRGYHPYMPITISPRLHFKLLDWVCFIVVLALLSCAIWL